MEMFYFLAENSVRIWERLGWAKEKKIRISETTITENILFDFWFANKHFDMPIEIYEAKNEKAEGNDLEIYVETEKGYLLFACQAKKIQARDKYSSIPHKGRGGSQVDLLLSFAKRKRGLACYLFYNFSNNLDVFDIEQETQADINNFGCTIASAACVKDNFYSDEVSLKNPRWKIPTFFDLHPNMAVPLHWAVSNMLNDTQSSILSYLGFRNVDNCKYYTREELEEDERWKYIRELGQIGRIGPDPRDKAAFKIQADESNAFRPKYRLLISKQQEDNVPNKRSITKLT